MAPSVHRAVKAKALNSMKLQNRKCHGHWKDNSEGFGIKEPVNLGQIPPEDCPKTQTLEVLGFHVSKANLL